MSQLGMRQLGVWQLVMRLFGFWHCGGEDAMGQLGSHGVIIHYVMEFTAQG